MTNQIITEKIPQEMKDCSQWVCWKAVPGDNGRVDKIPINPMNNRNASTADPKTWASFDKTIQHYERRKDRGINGIGFVFSKEDPFIGIDLDDCVNLETKKMDLQAEAYVEKLYSYSEITPSGKGVHTIIKGKIPGTRRRNGNFEMYPQGRFFTVTGNHIEGTPATVESRQQEIDTLYRDIFGEEKPKTQTPISPTQLPDEELLQKAKSAKNGEKFQRLMEGDIADYRSPSEADLALCVLLAFWCKNNPEQIDRLFRQSKLYRKKWDEKHGDKTYGQMTIQTALENSTEVYTPAGEESKDSPDIKILDMLNANEVGDAHLFVKLNYGKFVYDHSAGRWYEWRKHFWKEDIADKVTTAMENVTEEYFQETGRQNIERLQAEKAGRTEKAHMHQKNQDSLFARIRALQSGRRKQSVLKLAAADWSDRGYKSLALIGDEWDQDPMLLGCKNGVIDLVTGELREGKPDDFIKSIAPTNWHGINTPAPTWERFLEDIFNKDTALIDYVQRLFGYAVTGKVTDHVFPILFGHGRNGKSTLVETINFVLGNLSGPIEAELLLETYRPRQAGSATSDIMALRGKRLVWASETKEDRSLNVGKLKWLTGADTRVGREVFGHHQVTYSPTDTLFLLTNHKPHVPADDYSTWQRIHLIPFNLSFVDKPEKDSERQRDPDLPRKLKTEASGILAWLVEGAREWTQQGLAPPNSVIAATNDYRKDEDLIGQFISEQCVVKDNVEIKSGELFTAYKNWCNEIGAQPDNGTKFGKAIKKRFDSYKDQYVHYIGIDILATDYDTN